MSAREAPYRAPERPAGVAAEDRLRRRAEATWRASEAARAATTARRRRLRRLLTGAALALGLWLLAGPALGWLAGEFGSPRVRSALNFSAFVALLSLFMSAVAAVGLRNDPRKSEAGPRPPVP